MAKANPFRFSTKYQDDETDLLYYGYRYYNASTGRWISRDPIGERTGGNLYLFCRNNGCSRGDKLGRWDFDVIWHLNEPANSAIWPPQYQDVDALTVPKERTYSKSNRQDGNCTVYAINVRAIYDLYFKEGVDPESKTASGGTLVAHEMGHVSYYNSPLLEFENRFNGYRLCCSSCKSKLEKWMDADFETAKAQGDVESAQYDLDSGDYPAGNPNIPVIQQNVSTLSAALAQEKIKSDAAKQKFDDCLAKENKKTGKQQ